jgi:hypothetical protein
MHMLVDTSHPLTRGGLLHEILSTQQEKADQRVLHRLIIRSILATSSCMPVCVCVHMLGGTFV